MTLKKDIYSLGLIAFGLNLVLFLTLSINLFLGFAVLLLIFFAIVGNSKLFFAFFIQAIFFQNTFIAFFSGVIGSNTEFKVLHGINFLLPSLLAVFIFKNSSMFISKSFYLRTIGVILLLIIYFVFGMMNYGVMNSVVYLRLYVAPILYLLAGIYFSNRLELPFLNNNMKGLFIICVIITALQFLFPLIVSFFLNDLSYFGIKVGVDNWEELLAFYRKKRLFNISWFDVKLARIGSLIKSIISLGYFLSILGVYFFWPYKKGRLFLIFILMVLSVNSKGAFLVIFFSMLLYFLMYRINLSKNLAFMIYFIINVLLVYLGIYSRNEHIVGFFSGIEYLPTIGNGLGFGGNLSSSLVSNYSGSPLPDLGYWTRFQNGSESVFGVLFSSLGIMSLFYIYYFADTIKKLFRLFDSSTVQVNILKILTIVLFVQGIYQEEAFSPYAFGLVMFLVGLNLKSVHENKAISV
ncbi:hypothetical protein [Maribacter sp. MMG018]|uniref:hypothetical protein n=1 Tax=Maribacter sp. MMG018 TaxID=2822688 RepID=UPI001B38DA53|nr:hypothetical protein [Maribacter sp. MMG018]